MKFETTFSCGDTAWVCQDTGPRQLTIGQIRIEYTHSPGLDPDSMFDNYKAHPEELLETYMCVETGIKSGNVYELGKHIFRTEAECIESNKERIADAKRAAAEREALERRQLLDKEAYFRYELARIAAAKAEAA